MEALGVLAVWWHEQQLTKQMLWTAELFDEIEGEILEARDIAFVIGYLDEKEAGAVEQKRLPPGPPPPPLQSTPPLQLLSPAKEAKQLPLEQNNAKEDKRVCFWEELGDVNDEQWWKNMVVAELGMVEKQQQGLQPTTWVDKGDDTGGEQSISSPPRGALSVTHLTFSCQAVVDGVHLQAGDAQRGRKFQTVAQEGGEQESRRLGGGLGFDFFVGPGEEHGRRRRCCPLRESLREKEKTIACRRSTCSKRHVLLQNSLYYFSCLEDSGFRSVLGLVLKLVL